MTDRPIIFSAPMVKALLDGRKTQTRRLAWGDASFVGDRCIKPGEHISTAHLGSTPVPLTHRPAVWQRVQPGDRLYVRECFSFDRLDVDRDGTLPPWYWADGNPEDGDWTKPKPSIHMPRWASRLTLTVTEVRRQWLQEIDGIDALAEGITREDGVAPWRVFMRLWNDIHGDGAWQSNPEIVALRFSCERKNIDDCSR